MKQEKLNQKIFQVLSHIIKKEVQPQNCVAFFKEIDCSVIENIRHHYSIKESQKPSYTAFIIKAISEAVKEHPWVNARIFPSFPYSKIVRFSEIHTAVACETHLPGAEFMAFVDVIKKTDDKTIDAINRELCRLAKADIHNNPQLKSFIQIIKNCPVFLARQLCTLPAFFPSLWMKYRGAGIIISSPSKYGVDAVAGSWPHPLGFSFGLVQKKPIVKNNKLEIARCFTLTMSFDRRILAGGPAARFFNSIANNLMNHEFLASQLEENLTVKENFEEKITAIA
jgi:pyruvate/2-oxoglutarate dehydrogenase complex dihydrolipoamide acyltransferase (E2) component